jgi:hypothetical protein
MFRDKRWWWYAANTAFAGTVSWSCSHGIDVPMRDATHEGCARVLQDHDAIARDPTYAAQPVDVREPYEIHVAHCFLIAHRADAALALARGWSDANSLERAETTARAEASLGHEDAVRTALEAVRDESPRRPRFLRRGKRAQGVRA